MHVFLCHCEPCCRDWEVPVLLSRHSPLGDYVGESFGKPRYQDKPHEWPFLFVCFDCLRKTKIEALDRVLRPLSEVTLESLRSHNGPKSLWRVQITSDDPPNVETFYTVALRGSVKVHFADLAMRAFNELTPIHENTVTLECFVYDFS